MRGRALIAVLPNAIEVTPPAHEPPEQSLPFPEPRAADDHGDLLLVATCDAVYALVPPSAAGGGIKQREGSSEGGSPEF